MQGESASCKRSETRGSLEARLPLSQGISDANLIPLLIAAGYYYMHKPPHEMITNACLGSTNAMVCYAIARNVDSEFEALFLRCRYSTGFLGIPCHRHEEYSGGLLPSSQANDVNP